MRDGPLGFARFVAPCLALMTLPGSAGDLRFNRDIRPLLAEHCFQCHGPDASARKAKLRLDTREGAFADRDSGVVIQPGHPEASLLVQRIRSTDPEEVMPPPGIKKPLKTGEMAILESWVRQGAAYEGHWAFQPIDRPAVPDGGTIPGAALRNPIDAFILRPLAARGLSPSMEADRRTLYRRLSLDLTGLPPRPADVDAFVANPDPDAYDHAVDTFLDSPHFGERMAVFWLDLVRYADTVGYHGDQPYSVWPYRDYVIRAFNANMGFDEFTVENLAGDLLPNPTRDQRVASGYNRLLMITAEGGAQDREYRAKYAADRVRNASTVWMGATLGCAECHDHKYDPFTSRDFYSFAAFFADLKEKGFYDRGYPTGDWGPALALPNPSQEAASRDLERQIASVEHTLKTPTPELKEAQVQWESTLLSAGAPDLGPWHALGPFQADSFDAAYDRDFGVEKGGINLERTFDDGRLAWKPHPEWKDGEVQTLQGDNSATYLFRTLHVDSPRDLVISVGSDDALKIWLNGDEVLSNRVQRAVAPDQERPTLKLKAGENGLLLKIVNAGGGYGFYFKPIGTAPQEILDIVRVPEPDRTAEQREKLTTHFLSVTPLLADARHELDQAQTEFKRLTSKIPTTLVSEALPEPRTTRILRRGNWQDDGGAVVEPAVPGFLPHPGLAGRRLTRRDLAEWLVSPENPLTARVFVNRLWNQFFGVGLSRKLEDIGAQGEWPSHPELLDWLASEFRDSGWNVKHMVRLLVTSATYRQDSKETETLRAADPDNRLLARQTPIRVDAEFVRDSALAIGGLLVDQLGGPSVKPYQPAGYYSQLNFPKREYQADHGENQYRRGLYTHWQRTFLHPSLAAFDAPTREECTAERVRSNTPQQALVLLNDPTFVEAARAFAARILREGGSTPRSRIEFAYREALSRLPAPEEVRILSDLHDAHAREYSQDPDAAREVLSVGDRPTPEDLPPADLAAWTSVARTILNLHEVITRG